MLFVFEKANIFNTHYYDSQSPLYVLATRVRDKLERLPVPPHVAGAAPPLQTTRSANDKHDKKQTECNIISLSLSHSHILTLYIHMYTASSMPGSYPAQAAPAQPGQTARELEQKSLHFVVLEAIDGTTNTLRTKSGGATSGAVRDDADSTTWLRFGQVEFNVKKQRVRCCV